MKYCCHLLVVSASFLIIGCDRKPFSSGLVEQNSEPTPKQKPLNHITESEIEGAFGKRLGEIFDLSTALGRDDEKDGTPIYEFAPDKRFGTMDKYYVVITPLTHKICSIWAKGPMKAAPRSGNLDAIIAMLEQKYGENQASDRQNGNRQYYIRGNHCVYVSVARYMKDDEIIQIEYTDSSLNRTAEAENKEILKQKVRKLDNSGL